MHERGIALILTLWIVLILSVIVTKLILSIRLETKAVTNYKLTIQALSIAEAGIMHAISLLKQDKNNEDTLDDIWAIPVEKPFGNGTYTIIITDEARKININYATEGMLIEVGIPQDIVRKLIQYKIHNHKFYSVMPELRRFMDKNLYNHIKDKITTWGEININIADKDTLTILTHKLGIDKSDELIDIIINHRPFTTKYALFTIINDKTINELLNPYITVSGMINKNTASDTVLKAYTDELTQLPIPEDTIFTSTSKYFSIISTGSVGSICKTIHSVVKRINKENEPIIEIIYWHEII